MLKITNDKLNNFFENNTIITVKEAEKIGIKRQILSNLCKKGILERVKQGVYQKNDTITDEFVKIQKNNNVIFSNTTALYFHNLTDRVPNTISITVPQGYNVLHITKKFKNLKIHYVKKEIFESGKIETLSKMGAKIYIYDKERTICDIIKNKEKIDVDVFSKALKLFFKDKDIKVRKLIKYSKELKIEKKVREYVEVLIWHQKS